MLNADHSALVLLLLHPQITNLLAMQSKEIANPSGAEKLVIQIPMLSSFDVDERAPIPLGQTLAIACRDQVERIEDGKHKPIDDPSYQPRYALLLVTPALVTPTAQPTTRN
jgi:hypothetical protein